MVTTNPLTILIYRPSNLQVVDFVVRCVELMGGVSLSGNFSQTSALAGGGGGSAQGHTLHLKFWISIRWPHANLHSWPNLLTAEKS